MTEGCRVGDVAQRMLRRLAALSCLLLLLCGGCAPKAGLFPLPEAGLRSRPLEDEAGFTGMPQAIRQSIRYYRRLPSTAVFRYGDHLYTPRELEASMLLFLDIVENLEGEERLEAIRERFLFFESRNDRGKAFFTGYYEPLIPGSLMPTDSFFAGYGIIFIFVLPGQGEPGALCRDGDPSRRPRESRSARQAGGEKGGSLR